MAIMKTIAIDLAEGVCKTKIGEVTNKELYSYGRGIWFSTPLAAYSAAIKLGIHPDQNLEDGDYVAVLPDEDGEFGD